MLAVSKLSRGVFAFINIVLPNYLGNAKGLWQRYRSVLPIWITALCGVTLSLALFTWSKHWEQERISAELERHAQAYVKPLRQSIVSVSQTIEAIQKLYKIQGAIDRESFRTFLSREYSGPPGVEAFEWISLVNAPQRPALETAVRNSGIFDFEIRERTHQGLLTAAAAREVYYPVIYTEPADINGHTLGLDLGTEPSMLETMQQAMQRDAITVTPAIETENYAGKQHVVRFLLPVRANHQPLGNHGLTVGFASGVLFIDSLIEEILGDLQQSRGVQLNIYDGTERATATQIYTSNWRQTGSSNNRVIGLWETSISLGQRTWHLEFSRLSNRYWGLGTAWLVLALGLTASGVLTLYFWNIHSHTRRVEQLVDVRTRSLEQVNRSLRGEIAERRNMEQRLYHNAYHDQLTGSLNRRAFQERLTARFQDASAIDDWSFAILFVDMDRFKIINDTHGHHAGDAVIKQITKRINHVLRTIDIVARLGGDEFAIMLEYNANTDTTTDVAHRLLQHMQEPFDVNGEEFLTSCSIGIAVAHNGYQAPEDILRDADIAMYQAKRHGRSCYVLFDAEMHENASRELRLQTDLRKAMERNELAVHYQPIFDLRENRLNGFEALLRWRHPQDGFISPEVFIPISEEIGIINEIGAWVLDRALGDLRHWSDALGAGELCINVNLSPKQLGRKDLASCIQRSLLQHRIDPARCQLEVTETALGTSPEETAEHLAALKALGVKLYIDDFGTGHASLNHLALFPVDGLKIDRSFVDQMERDATKREIVQAIVSLRKALQLNITAEGIENAKQMALLSDLQCDFGQGYFLSRPMTADDTARYIHRQLEKTHAEHHCLSAQGSR